MAYRCDGCGNKTRFDVFESKRTRSFHHYSLAGELTVEEEEVLEGGVERVVCRWCGSSDQIVRVDADGLGRTPEQAGRENVEAGG